MKNKVKHYREKANLTQEELANKADISRTTLSVIENGGPIVVKTDTLQKIAKALNKKVSEIFFTQ